MPTNIRVELGPRSYDVRIGAGLLAELGAFATTGGKPRRGAVVIADTTVAGLYGQRALDSLAQAGLPATLLQFPAGEANKTLATYAALMDQLLRLEPAIDRSTLVIALGGGVTGDISGFVAATALRGLDWLQCPTTLLADVDASVGGKTAVDHSRGKNLVGAFHQPRGVLIDVRTLASLPPAQFADGLGECVKHGVIRDRSLLEFIEDNADSILARDENVLTELVSRNVAIKAAVVSADERESGERAHLNFGHTIGHAFETLIGYERIGHGFAVSLGMVAACRMAVNRGLLKEADCRRVETLLARLGLPVKLADLKTIATPQPTNPKTEHMRAWAGEVLAFSPDAIWRVMQHDKKAQAGKVRMVLPTTVGMVAIFDDVTAQQVTEAVRAL